MALTRNEARERIAAIWGVEGYDVSIAQFDGATIVSLAHSTHRLDANGHPVCHKACGELEAAAYEKKLLK